MVYTLSTTIRISKGTKKLLDKMLIELENELGRRLSYDEAIKILIERAKTRKRPELLLELLEMKGSEELSEKAQKILREERRREIEIYKRRYGA